MKTKNLILFFLFILLGTSCKYKVDFDQNGLMSVQEMLIKKFGQGVWYAEITLLDTEDKGTLIRVKETSNPSSLQGKSWVKESEDWIPLASVIFQFNDGKPEEHLFQLGKTVSLSKIAALVSQAEEAFQKSGGKDLKVNFLSVQTPNIQTGNDTGVQIIIAIQDQANRERHRFVFDRNGELLSVQN